MAEANGICRCGLRIMQPTGRGRPRKRCEACSPHRPERSAAYSPRPRATRICTECGSTFARLTLALFCSDKCKYRARHRSAPRVPCADCAGPTGYMLGVVDKATCRPCRRSRETYRHPVPPTQTWECKYCGAQCERKTVRGSLPKWCSDCRRKRGNAGIPSRSNIRRLIYERDGWLCWLCETTVDRTLIGSSSQWRPSLDHVTPVSLGGTDDESNLRLAHQWCNAVRGDGHMYSPEDFRAAR